MAATRIYGRAPTEVAHSEAIERRPLVRRQAPARSGGRKTPRDRVSRSILQVLVVTDAQDKAEGLATQVGRWGHATRTVRDGLATLRVAADQQPDVVLLDMELPQLDGFQVARQLRLDSPSSDCFIIAVTERAEDRRRQQSIQAGIDLWLVKPVDPSVLETLLLLECVRVNRSRMA